MSLFLTDDVAISVDIKKRDCHSRTLSSFSITDHINTHVKSTPKKSLSLREANFYRRRSNLDVILQTRLPRHFVPRNDKLY